MSIHPRVTEVERLLFRSDVAAAGAFRCPSSHRLYKDSGPASGYLLVFPRTSTTIVYDGTRPVTAAAPLAVFYNEGQAYTRRRIDDADACDWFMLAPDVVRDIVGRYDESARDRESRIFPLFTGYAGARIYLAQRRLHMALASCERHDPLQVEESVIALFDAAFREAFGKRARKTGECDGVETVKSIIAARPAATPTLRALAASAGCSPYELCRLFRARTGYTITAFRHALRLRLALPLLRRPASDISDIALTLGYSSHSHFTMQFRRHFGITPAQFRAGATRIVS